jgi:DNA-binding transcriptional regulator YdaS (Cro superfamily)
VTGIQKAVKKAGNTGKLARAINTDRQLIEYWIRTGRPSPRFCQAIFASTGISLHDLRPDVYPV